MVNNNKKNFDLPFKIKLVLNTLLNIGFWRQKRADIFKFAIFVQNSVRNNEFLRIGVFCQNREENNNLTKHSYSVTSALCFEPFLAS